MRGTATLWAGKGLVLTLQNVSRMAFWRREKTAEWRRRQIARRMVGLPPQYEDLAAGVGLLALLGGLFVAVVTWRMLGAGTVAPAAPLAVVFVLVLTAMVPLRRRYRHIVAGALVLSLLVGALAVSVTRRGTLVPLTASANTTRLTSTDLR